MYEKLTRWVASDHLNTAYFEACLDENPGDGCLIRAALGDIAKTRNMSRLAKK